MPALAGLWCVAALFAVGISGLVFGRSRVATTLVYGASLAATLVALTLALTFLLTNGQASSVTLPLGLPGIGAHFRLDALGGVLSDRRQSRRGDREPLRARLRPA